MTVMTRPAVLDAASAGACRSTEQLLATRPSSRAVWGETDSSTLICRQVQDITHDVRTSFSNRWNRHCSNTSQASSSPCNCEIDGRPVNRCYTISSPPTRPISWVSPSNVSAEAWVSNWLHDTMARGKRISAEGPFGVSTIARHPSAKYLFLSGGSGITPVMSMTRALYDLGSDADIVFVHSARTPSDIIFRRELETIASTAPSVRVLHVCERDSPGEPWGGLRGFLGTEMLQLVAPDLADRVRVLLRARALHGRRSPDAGRCRLRHAELPRGVLHLRGSQDGGVLGAYDHQAIRRRRRSRATHRKRTPMPSSLSQSPHGQLCR